jgi:hypothetical protein
VAECSKIVGPALKPCTEYKFGTDSAIQCAARYGEPASKYAFSEICVRHAEESEFRRACELSAAEARGDAQRVIDLLEMKKTERATNPASDRNLAGNNSAGDATSDVPAFAEQELENALRRPLAPDATISLLSVEAVSTGTTKGLPAAILKAKYTASVPGIGVLKQCSFVHYTFNQEWQTYEHVIIGMVASGEGRCDPNSGCFGCGGVPFNAYIKRLGYSGLLPGMASIPPEPTAGNSADLPNTSISAAAPPDTGHRGPENTDGKRERAELKRALSTMFGAHAAEGASGGGEAEPTSASSKTTVRSAKAKIPTQRDGVGEPGRRQPAEVRAMDDGAVVVGSLDKELIRQVIRRSTGQVLRCYEQSLRATPTLAGAIAVRFVIAPNGGVQTARVAEGTSISDPTLQECVTSQIRTWKFPSPKGGGSVLVTYPFELSAK